ncbi:MAG: HEAT repeat domain-containing protein [bacterium]
MGLVGRLRTSWLMRVLRASATTTPEALAEAKAALADMGSAALEPLFESLAHPAARASALEVLERLLNTDTLPDFVEALAKGEPRVAAGIAEVLEKGRRYEAKDLLPYLSEREVPKARLEPILQARASDLSPRELLSMLPDLDREARSIVYRIIEARADESLLPEALRYLAHKDWWMRVQMAKLLAKIPSEDSERALAGVLTDPNKAVRLSAVKGLETLGSKLAVPFLANVLRDGDLTVQAAAIDALIAIGDPGAVPHLVDVLKDESEQCRRGAVEVLNEVATTEAIQDLVHALRDADWWVRVRAADALGTIGGEKVVEAILALMADEDVHIRRYAVEILNTIPDGRSVDSLIQALEDEDWWVRERSIDALGRTKDARAVAPLLKLLAVDPDAAGLCARALGAIGDPGAVDGLLDALQRATVDEIRHEIVAALQAITSAGRVKGRRLKKVEEALKSEGVRVERTRLRPMEIHQGGGRSRPVDDEPGPSPIAHREHAPAPAPASPPPPPAKHEEDLRAEDVEDGTVILDRYKVIRRIGSGGFSTVFLVEDRVISDQVILKILSHHLSLDEGSMARFVQELKLSRKISHPNIIRIHDLLEIGKARAISMEYFPGQDLGRILDECKTMSPERTVPIVLQICAGLAAAHEVGIIHRDIKPANILVGEGDRVKVVDFGLAAASREAENRLTRTGHLVGTPHYMAPEVIRGEKIDGRADLYSLAIMSYEMLSGRLPYDGDNPMNVLFRHLDGDAPKLAEVCSIPEALSQAVMRAMAVSRDDRPSTAAELMETFRAAMS